MKSKFITMAVLVAGAALVGAANAEPARVQLAQYGGDYGGGGGYGGGGRYCRNWAQGMVAMGIEAARKGCLQYGPQGLHTNFEAHMDFCLNSPPGRTQRRAARANALLASCNR